MSRNTEIRTGEKEGPCASNESFRREAIKRRSVSEKRKARVEVLSALWKKGVVVTGMIDFSDVGNVRREVCFGHVQLTAGL